MNIAELAWAAPATCEVRLAPAIAPETIVGAVDSGLRVYGEGQWRPVRPFVVEPDLPLIIANLEITNETISELASRVGLLQSQAAGASEPLENWHLIQELLHLTIDEPGTDQDELPIGRVEFAIGKNSSGRSLLLRPRTLYDAILLKTVVHINAGGSFFRCRECNRVADRGGLSLRRTDSEFCSTSCRIKHKNRRTNARRMLKTKPRGEGG